MNVKGIITYSNFKSSDYISMIDEIVPEIKLGKPGSINSAAIPNLKYLFTLNSETSPPPGYLDFKELYHSVGSDSQKILDQFENKLVPEDPINIQVSLNNQF
jgi:fatty-acyl-CoA synthase